MNARIRILPALFSVLLVLSACGGGIIGTGSGPTTEDDDYFPKRISPNLPPVLTDIPEVPDIPESDEDVNVPDSGVISQGWVTLNRILSRFEARRLAVQSELILLSSVFDDIELVCDAAGDAVCLIEPGVISAQYTDEVIAQIIDLYELTTSDETAHVLAQDVQLLSGTDLSFGHMSIDWAPDQESPRRLKVSPLALLPGSTLILNWNEDGSVVDFEIVENGVGDQYFYQRNTSTQQLTMAIHDEVVDMQTIPLVRLSRDIDDGSDMLVSAQLAAKRLIGQANDEAVYLETEIFNESTNGSGSTIIQEIIQTSVGGGMGESAECDAFDNFSGCAHGDLYISAEEVQGAEFASGLNQVTIHNVPDDIERFEIISAEVSLPLESRQFFCHGWKLSNADVQDIYCVADLTAVQSVSVLAFDTFGNQRFLLEAGVDVDGRELTVISGD